MKTVTSELVQRTVQSEGLILIFAHSCTLCLLCQRTNTTGVSFLGGFSVNIVTGLDFMPVMILSSDQNEK